MCRPRARGGEQAPRRRPKEATDGRGQTKPGRIPAMIDSILAHTEPPVIQAGPVEDEAFRVLKAFMYSTVYVDKVGKHEEQKVDKVI